MGEIKTLCSVRLYEVISICADRVLSLVFAMNFIRVYRCGIRCIRAVNAFDYFILFLVGMFI